MKAFAIGALVMFGCFSLHAQGDPAVVPATGAGAAQTPSPSASSTQTPSTQPQSTQTPQGTPSTPPSQAPPVVPGSGAQPVRGADGTYTLRRTSRLVILDVVVTDKQGNLVNGLTRDDFHVTELDQPQTILNFEAAGAHSTPASADINSTADLDKLAPQAPVNILLLDEFNTRFEDMAFARYSLKKLLQKQPDHLNTPTMLIAVDLQHFTVLQDYTQNKAALLTALDHHFVAYPWQVHNGGWLAERYATAFATLTRVAPSRP